MSKKQVMLDIFVNFWIGIHIIMVCNNPKPIEWKGMTAPLFNVIYPTTASLIFLYMIFGCQWKKLQKNLWNNAFNRSFVIMFVAFEFSCLVSSNFSSTWASRYFFFFGIPFISSLLRLGKLRLETLMIANWICIVALLPRTYEEHYIDDVSRVKAGTDNTIYFANILTVMVTQILMYIPMYRNKIWHWFFAIGTTLGGLTMIVHTQTRGAWLVVCLECIVLIIYLLCGNKKQKFSAIVLMVIFGLLIFFSLQIEVVKDRLDAFKNAMEKYEDGNASSSSGIRIEMIKGGLQVFTDSIPNFLIGVGPQNTNCEAQKFVEAKYPIGRMGHLHNEFVQVAAGQGILGILTHLFLDITIIWYFGRMAFLSWKKYLPEKAILSRDPEDIKTRMIGFMGLALLFGYEGAGLTNMAFSEDTLLMHFSVCILFLHILSIQRDSGMEDCKCLLGALLSLFKAKNQVLPMVMKDVEMSPTSANSDMKDDNDNNDDDEPGFEESFQPPILSDDTSLTENESHNSKEKHNHIENDQLEAMNDSRKTEEVRNIESESQQQQPHQSDDNIKDNNLSNTDTAPPKALIVKTDPVANDSFISPRTATNISTLTTLTTTDVPTEPTNPTKAPKNSKKKTKKKNKNEVTTITIEPSAASIINPSLSVPPKSILRTKSLRLTRCPSNNSIQATSASPSNVVLLKNRKKLVSTGSTGNSMFGVAKSKSSRRNNRFRKLPPLASGI